jgi:hypothetical protein
MNEIGRGGPRPTKITRGPAVLHRDILADHVTELAEPLLQRLGARRRAGGKGQVGDPPHLPDRLRLGGERRRDQATSQRTEERAAVHHSMT